MIELAAGQPRDRQRVEALAQRRAGDRDRIDDVGLATLARRATGVGGQFRGHAQHRFAAAHRERSKRTRRHARLGLALSRVWRCDRLAPGRDAVYAQLRSTKGRGCVRASRGGAAHDRSLGKFSTHNHVVTPIRAVVGATVYFNKMETKLLYSSTGALASLTGQVHVSAAMAAAAPLAFAAVDAGKCVGTRVYLFLPDVPCIYNC
jgi:hypothetical protein